MYTSRNNANSKTTTVVLLVFQVHIPVHQEISSLTFSYPVLRIRDILGYGSGSADPHLCLTNPAPDPAIFVSDL